MPILTPDQLYPHFFTIYNSLVQPLNWPVFNGDLPETDAEAVEQFMGHLYDLLEEASPQQFLAHRQNSQAFREHAAKLGDWAQMIWAPTGVGQLLLHENYPTLHKRESQELYPILVQMAFVSILYQMRERLIRDQAPIPVPSYLTDDKLAQHLNILHKRVRNLFTEVKAELPWRITPYFSHQKSLVIANTFKYRVLLEIGAFSLFSSFVAQQMRDIRNPWGSYVVDAIDGALVAILLSTGLVAVAIGLYMLCHRADEATVKANVASISAEESRVNAAISTLDNQRDLILKLPLGMPEIKLAAAKIDAAAQPPTVVTTVRIH